MFKIFSHRLIRLWRKKSVIYKIIPATREYLGERRILTNSPLFCQIISNKANSKA